MRRDRKSSKAAPSEPVSGAETRTLHLDDVVPYWRNPRVITDEAVNAVAESIQRYGYQQPIEVEPENVIIMGHTRYSARRRLGVTEVTVRVADQDPRKVKQLRLVDNRAHEYTSWDFDKLIDELDKLDDQLMHGYFPEVVAAPDAGPDVDFREEDALDLEGTTGQDPNVEFLCPSCFHEWEMPVTREQIMSGRLGGSE